MLSETAQTRILTLNQCQQCVVNEDVRILLEMIPIFPQQIFEILWLSQFETKLNGGSQIAETNTQ